MKPVFLQSEMGGERSSCASIYLPFTYLGLV